MKQNIQSKPLTQVNLNQKYKVVKIVADLKVKRRLLDYGFVDTCVQVINKSSLNGVYLLQIRDYVLALRESEVKCIEVIEYV